MKVLGCITGLFVAAAVALPAFGQDAGTTATPTDEARVFNAPVTTPLGQGWYGAASTTTQTAWMSRAEPWSNDLVQVQGAGRVAVVGSGVGSMAGTSSRLITGIAQWRVPQDGTMWEVRITGLDPAAPLSGAGVLQAIHGDTGIGSDRFPRTLAYVAVYGPADVYRNGQRVATGLRGHIMATQGIRDPQTGRLLGTPSVRPQDIQFHVLVEGSIPGQPRDSLYVFWPQATLDIRNLGQPVALSPEEIRIAQSVFGVPSAAVAGFREPLAPMRLAIVSLRDRFLARSVPAMMPGEVELQVVNESSTPRGLYIQGPGIEQRTRLLNPGETETLRLTLMTGTYRLASFTAAMPQMSDYMHWDTIIVRPCP